MKRNSQSPITTICLTGGIACGKTLVASFFARMGIPVIEADVVCHDLIKPGKPAHAAIVEIFGDAALGRHGVVDRAALGRIVFADQARLAALNAVLHPAARSAIAAWIKAGCPKDAPGVLVPEKGRQNLQPNRTRLAAAVVPLLFEVGWEADWDFVVSVVSPPTLQRRRLAARGLDADGVNGRLAAQWPMLEKARRAHAVIFNAGDSCLAEEQARRIIYQIRSKMED